MRQVAQVYRLQDNTYEVLEINPQAVQAVIDGDAITPQTIQFEVSIKNGGSLLPVTFNVFTYLSDGTKQYVQTNVPNGSTVSLDSGILLDDELKNLPSYTKTFFVEYSNTNSTVEKQFYVFVRNKNYSWLANWHTSTVITNDSIATGKAFFGTKLEDGRLRGVYIGTEANLEGSDISQGITQIDGNEEVFKVTYDDSGVLFKVGSEDSYIDYNTSDKRLRVKAVIEALESSNTLLYGDAPYNLPDGSIFYFRGGLVDIIKSSHPQEITEEEYNILWTGGLVDEQSQSFIQSLYGYSTDRTYIDGGKIYTGTITAEQINADQLFTKKFQLKDGGAIYTESKTDFDDGINGLWLDKKSFELKANDSYLKFDAERGIFAIKGDIAGGDKISWTDTQHSGFYLSSTGQFIVGNQNHYIRWNGSSLVIKGKLLLENNAELENITDVIDANLPVGTPTGGVLTRPFAINESYNGRQTNGTIRIKKSIYIHPAGSIYTLQQNTQITTDIGDGTYKERYIVFIGDNQSQFTFGTNENTRFIVQSYDPWQKKWYRHYNGQAQEFEFKPYYVVVQKVFGTDSISSIQYFQQVMDDIQAYRTFIEPTLDVETASGNVQLGKAVTGTGGTSTIPTNGQKYIGSSYYTFGSGNSSGTGAENQYVEIDLGKQYSVKKHLIYFWSQDDRYYWFKLLFSHDGVNWFYAAGSPDANGWITSKRRENEYQVLNPTVIEFEKPIQQRYWRIYANGNTTNNGNHIYEWEIIGDSGYQQEIDGNLLVDGTVKANKIDVVDLFAQEIEITGQGHIKAGKNEYLDTQSGFWLGFDSDGIQKFVIGNNDDAYYFSFDGYKVHSAGDHFGQFVGDQYFYNVEFVKDPAEETQIVYAQDIHQIYRHHETGLELLRTYGSNQHYIASLQNQVIKPQNQYSPRIGGVPDGAVTNWGTADISGVDTFTQEFSSSTNTVYYKVEVALFKTFPAGYFKNKPAGMYKYQTLVFDFSNKFLYGAYTGNNNRIEIIVDRLNRKVTAVAKDANGTELARKTLSQRSNIEQIQVRFYIADKPSTTQVANGQFYTFTTKDMGHQLVSIGIDEDQASDAINNFDPDQAENNVYGIVHQRTFEGVATQQYFADLQEKLWADEEFAPGTPVQIKNGKVVRQKNPWKKTWIVSTKPGMLLGKKRKNAVPVALCGTVEVYIDQDVDDEICLSLDGKLKKATWLDKLVGKYIIGKVIRKEDDHCLVFLY